MGILPGYGGLLVLHFGLNLAEFLHFGPIVRLLPARHLGLMSQLGQALIYIILIW